MKYLFEILILAILFYIFYDYITSPVFVAEKVINNSNVDFNALLSVNNQSEPINLYYINMDKSINRNNRFLSRMAKFNNYNIIRVKAITPNDLTEYIIDIPLHCIAMHDKEKSCLLSHFKAIEMAYNNNDEYAIIAEDDMIINKNINWEYFISKLPNDWEIIQLYYFKLKFKNNANFIKLQSDNFLIKTQNVLTSAAAYLINRKGMINILSRIKNKNLNLLDSKNLCLADFIIFDDINRYILTSPIIKTEELDSTLNPHHVPLRKINNIL